MMSLSFPSFVACLAALAGAPQAFPFCPDDVCCFKTSISFVDSICEVLGAVLQGVPTAVWPQAVPVLGDASVDLALGQLPAFVCAHGVTRLTVVPSVMHLLLASKDMRGAAWGASHEAAGGDMTGRRADAVADAVCVHGAEVGAARAGHLASQLRNLRMLVLSGELLSNALLHDVAHVLPVRHRSSRFVWLFHVLQVVIAPRLVTLFTLSITAAVRAPLS
jgi:hypothetical protein